MATAAELKARLAKYATPKSEPSQKVAAESIVTGTITLGPQLAETPAVVEAAAGSEVSVVTDLQSATLIVVERPVESASSADNGSVPDDDGDDLETKLDKSNPVHQNFLQRLADLEAALLARDPLMKTHLGEIHKNMIQYEEISNLLRPHEIAKIMAAQQQHTGVILRAEVVGKSKAAAGKKAAKLGVSDL